MAETLQERLAAVKELTKLFWFERMVHLGATVVALFVLLWSAYESFRTGKMGPAEFVAMFGSAGAVAYSAGRLLLMWNEAMRRLMPMPKDGG